MKNQAQPNALRRLATATLALLSATSAFAASQTWTNAPVDATWTNVLNWVAKAVPGGINLSGNTVNADTVTFNAAISGTIGTAANPILTDPATATNGVRARQIGSIVFDTATCGAYVISNTWPMNYTDANTVYSGELFVSHNGSITMNSTVVNPQKIMVPIFTRLPSSTDGIYNFVNNAASVSATMFLAAVTNNSAATRGTTFVLDGSNTGTNTIAALSKGTTTSTTAANGIRKQGAGTWILSGPNDIANTTGTSININAGLLICKDGNALGSALNVNVNSNGVLEVDNVTMGAQNFTLSLNGTLRVNGSSVFSKVTLATNTGSAPTLATTSSSDTFIINTFTGGASDGIVHVAGSGSVQMYTDATITNAAWSFDGGTFQMDSTYALGQNAKYLGFGASSTAKLQLNNYSYTALSLTSNPTAGSPVVENGNSSGSVLTVSNTIANTFAGVIRDGTGGGTVSLVKTGIGTLTLAGANTYTGNTTLGMGALNVTGSLGSSAVTAASGATFGGSGTAGGSVDIQSGATLAPGNAAVGNLTVGSLTLESGSLLNYEFNSTTNDQVNVTTSSGLTLNGGAINLYQEGGTLAFTTPGTYKLFQFSGSLNGGIGNLSVANQQPGFAYTFGVSGNYVTLTITASTTSVIAAWNVDANGNWTDATKWTTNPKVPGSAGDTATFGVGTALRTVTLNANESVAGITFTNPNSFVIAGSSTLTMNNSGSAAGITALSGANNAIQTPVTLNDNVTINASSSQALTVSGAVANGSNGSKALTIGGAGTVTLSGNNTYGPSAGSVGTTLSGSGTLKLGSSTALGAGDVSMTASSTVIPATTGLNVANAVAVSSLVTATVNNSGNDLTLSGVISGGGSLVKNGTGTLTLSSGNNSFAGNTTVNAGTLSIDNDVELGAGPGTETPDSLVLNGGLLLGTASTTLYINRDIGIGQLSGATGTNAYIDAAASTTLTINGVIASAGNTGTNGVLINSVTGHTGTVALAGANTFTGPTHIGYGNLELDNALALQYSTLQYTNGSMTFGSGLSAFTIGSLEGTQNIALVNVSLTGVTLTLGGNNDTSSYPGTFSDSTATSGTGALDKEGTGTFTLTGANQFGGSLTVNNGTLAIATGGSISCGPTYPGAFGLVLINGGTLKSTNLTDVYAGNGLGIFVSNGVASFDSMRSHSAGSNLDGAEILVGGGVLNAGDINLRRTANSVVTASTTSGLVVTNGQANVGTLEVGTLNSSATVYVSGGTLVVTGIVTVANQTSGGRGGIIQVAGGNFSVIDTNYGLLMVKTNPSGATANQVANLSLTGGTTTLGALTFGYDDQVPTNSSSTVTVSTNAALYIGYGGIKKNAPDTNMTTTININGGTLGVTTNQTIMHPLVLNVNGTVQPVIRAADASGLAQNLLLGGALSGTGTLTKTGNGTLTITNGNYFTGGVALNAGTLNINGNWAIGGAVYVGGFAFNGGTLQYAPAFANNGTGDITVNTAATPVAQVVTLNSNAVIDVNGNAVTYANSIGNGGNGGLVVNSTTAGGSLVLQGTNNYKGNTVVNSGTLELATASLTTTSTVSVASSAVLKLDFTTTNQVGALILNGVTKPAGVYNSVNAAPYITGTGSLVVPSPVNPNPTNITYSVSGSTLSLSWPADHQGWTLQQQTNGLTTGLGTNWTDVPGSTSLHATNITVDPTKPTVFYRLKYIAQ